MKVNYNIEEKKVSFDVDGVFKYGNNEILLKKDQNLIQNTDWNDKGYEIFDFLTPKEFVKIENGVKKLLLDLMIKNNIKVPDNFKIENYHLYVSDVEHIKIVSQMKKGFNVSEFPIKFELIEDKISAILGIKVNARGTHITAEEYYGNTDVYKEVYVFNIRIVRPFKFNDNNPPHKDVWIDRLKNAVNIYIPICGSTTKSSLPVMPNSHFLNEQIILRTENGSIINETKFSVPAVISLKNKKLNLVRPNPKKHEALIFSPYLIHGGAYNFEANKTRVSLEVRFWKA